jgi:hypothetical protein
MAPRRIAKSPESTPRSLRSKRCPGVLVEGDTLQDSDGRRQMGLQAAAVLDDRTPSIGIDLPMQIQRLIAPRASPTNRIAA